MFEGGAAAIVRTDGRNTFGTVAVENNRYTLDSRLWEVDAPSPPVELVMAAEQYNRVLRILDKGIPVELEVELKVSFSREDLNDYNVVAEIPGTDLADQIVLLGGHLQANPAGGGATDGRSRRRNIDGSRTYFQGIRDQTTSDCPGRTLGRT